MNATNASTQNENSLDSLVAGVVDEFRDRQKRGERPDIEEYAARHPEAGDLLRKVLATFQLLDGSISGESMALDAPLSGTLGDFRIIREVGRGGMGIVYEAEQISLARRVALKVLPFAATLDPRQLQRFHNEARAAASLHQEHIVPVFAVGQERGVHFFAMQFIEGQTVAALIAQQKQGPAPAASDAPTTGPSGSPISPLQPADTAPIAAATTATPPRDAAYFHQVAEWGIQAADALEHAHTLGIVHRDIKPGNLMIDAHNQLWIADFGLARRAAESDLTMTGDLLGTLRYMSPEQALAKHDLVDHRSDVYSLGATLYEMLTLHAAVEGKDRQEIIQQITQTDAPSLRSHDRRIPADLETIVLKALAKEPDGRYATAKDLADDLRRYLAQEPIQARRPTLRQKAGRWLSRHSRAVAGIALGLAIVAVALASGTLLALTAWEGEAKERIKAETAEQAQTQLTLTAKTERDKAIDAEKEKDAQKRIAEDERDLAFRHRYGAEIKLAQNAWEQGSLLFARDLLTTHLPKKNGLDLRGWEWRYLYGHCQVKNSPFQMKSTPECLAFTADGGYLAAVTLTKGPIAAHVHAWDVATGREFFLKQLQLGSVPKELQWSPDNTLLACIFKNAISIWKVKTGEMQIFPTRKQGEKDLIHSIAWSPNGKWVAISRAIESKKNKFNELDTTVEIWDVRLGAIVHTIGDGKSFTTSVAWSRDSQRLALLTFFTERPLEEYDSKPATLQQVRITTLATSSWKQEATFDTGWRQANHLPIPLGDLLWHPSSQKLAFLCTRGGIKKEEEKTKTADHTIMVWDSKTCQVVNRLEFDGPTASNLAWSPDGRHFVGIIGDRAHVWEMNKGSEMLSLLLKVRTARPRVAFSPDGRRVAAPGTYQTIKICDLSSGRAILETPGCSETPVLAWSPDGKKIAFADKNSTVHLVDVMSRLDHGIVNLKAVGRVGAKDSVVFSNLAWTADSERLYMSKHDGKSPGRIQLWDVVRGKELPCSIKLRSKMLSDKPAWNANGDRVALSNSGTNPSISIHDTITGNELHRFNPVRDANFVNLSLSPDGNQLYYYLSPHANPTGSRMRGNYVWNLQSGDNIQVSEDRFAFYGPEWSADSRYLTFNKLNQSGRITAIWDSKTREVICDIPVSAKEKGAPMRAVWSPNGTKLALFHKKGSNFIIWDIVARKVLQDCPGHFAAIRSLSWHKDGIRLASGGEDGRVKIWDTITGSELLDLPGPADRVFSVAFSPDGKRLAAGGPDGAIRIWDASPGYALDSPAKR